MNFLQVPDHLWRHVAKLSGLQLAILCDAWTWDAGGKPARRSNEQIAEMFGATTRAVTKSVKRLQELGLVEIEYGQNNIRHIKPRTTVHLNDCSPRTNVHPEQSFTPASNERSGEPRTTVHGSIEQSFTLIEHRIEQKEEQPIEKEDKPKKEAKPKSLEDVIEAFEAVGSTEDEAMAFFDYWESAGWRRKGGPIKDWKATARGWLRNQKKYGEQNSWRDRSSKQLDAAKALEWANSKR